MIPKWSGTRCVEAATRLPGVMLSPVNDGVWWSTLQELAVECEPRKFDAVELEPDSSHSASPYITSLLPGLVKNDVQCLRNVYLDRSLMVKFASAFGIDVHIAAQ